MAVLVGAIMSVGCLGPSPSESGRWHTVQPRENLYRIAQFYGTSVAAIERANGVNDVTNLQPGARLWIPGTSPERRPKGPLVPPPDVAAGLQNERGEPATGTPPSRLQRPAQGPVTSKFGPRWGRQHEGIDIGAKNGSRVLAAAAGRVQFSGRKGSYGWVVIVKHEGGLATVYAHNRRNHVRKGQRVKRGQHIADVGRSGNATGPHLHFEVLRNGRPVDPLRYVPR